MTKGIYARWTAVVAVLILAASAGRTAPAFFGQTTDEIPAKKYANILGKYFVEIDGATTILEFSIRQGGLWADSGDGRPVEIKPVKESLEEFACDDPESGHFDFKFQKDEKGEYTKCRIIAAALGLDIVATKMR